MTNTRKENYRESWAKRKHVAIKPEKDPMLDHMSIYLRATKGEIVEALIEFMARQPRDVQEGIMGFPGTKPVEARCVEPVIEPAKRPPLTPEQVAELRANADPDKGPKLKSTGRRGNMTKSLESEHKKTSSTQ